MELPKYNELYVPFLSAIRDGEIHALKEIKKSIQKELKLSEEAVLQRLPSGNQCIFDNRVGWASTYLKKAGLVCAAKRAHFQITDEGKALLESSAAITNQLLSERYPDFAGFIGNGKEIEETSEDTDQALTETPQETLERMYQAINRQLADDLLAEIMNQSSFFFEGLVVDLMRSMGYGDGFVTKASGDGGIDGVIHEDKLGFNLIYIQAKRWEPGMTVTKPEIQKFAGAMMGPPRVEKGLFITTARFSQGAREFADAQHIILVDGQKLCELMIEYGIGVSTQRTYRLKRIDSDYFSEN